VVAAGSVADCHDRGVIGGNRMVKRLNSSLGHYNGAATTGTLFASSLIGKPWNAWNESLR
jgi:hypothetical protein